MIVFERFRATNAGPFSHFDLDLKKRGLVRMIGKNGQGKSTIWHLFTQNHYAMTPNKASKADLMMTDQDYLLETTFSKNGSTYIAAQAAKSKTLSPEGKKYGTGVYLYRDGTDISMHKDPDTQKLIKQTMGWSLEEWFGYVYLAQQTSHTLINGTRSERQAYLSALFNMFWIDTVAANFSQKSKDLAAQIEGVEVKRQEYQIKTGLLNGRELEQMETNLSVLQEEIEFIETQLTQVRTEQEAHNAKQKLIKEIEALPPSSQSVEDINHELSVLKELQADFDAHQKSIANLRSELTKLPVVEEPLIPEDYDSIMAKPATDLALIQREHAALTELKASLVPAEAVTIPKDFQEVLASADLNEVQTKTKIEKIKQRPAAPTAVRPTAEAMQALQDKMGDLAVEAGLLKSRIKALEFNSDVCDKCGTTLNCEDRSAELAEKKEELEFVNTNHRDLSKELGDLRAADKLWRDHDALGPDESPELPALEEALALYQKKKQYRILDTQDKQYKAYTESTKRLESLPYYVEELKVHEKKSKYGALSAEKENYSKYKKELERIQKSITEAEQVVYEDKAPDIKTLQDDLVLAEKHARFKAELDSMSECADQSDRIQLLTTELSEQQTQVGSVKREVEDVRSLVKSIQDLQKELSESEGLYREKTKNDLLAKGYGKAGQLRERQLSRFSKYLEQALLSHTLRQLPLHRFKIVVDDGIDILATKAGDRPEPYDVKFMSGGEKGALSVAFLFALDDLLPPDRRTSVKILDEIESAFDGDKKLDFVQYTLPELKKRADTVIVISHSEVSNHGAFDVTWEIDGGTIKEIVHETREFAVEDSM